MPRDGSGIYTKPFPDVVPGTTIESAVFNGNTADVEQDLNAPRPIIAGGTGASSATDALFNLKGEMATQLVTNYDSHMWVPGSFRSAAGATGAPNGTSAFAGVCYIGEALANPPTNANVVVEARDMDSPVKPGQIYIRQKTAGVWSGWNITGDTDDDQADARHAIYAAPFDALAYNGMQINGSMEVSQEYGAAAIAVPTGVKYLLDGWKIVSVGVQSFSLAQTTTAPPGFAKSLVAQLYIANTAPALGDYAVLIHPIEGHRISRLAWGTANAQPVTIGFWVSAQRAGTYSGSVQNYNNTRSYPFTFTVGAGASFSTITIPGDTAGSWLTDNTVGMHLCFSLMLGGTYAGPPNAWAAANYMGATGTINGIAAISDQFSITGVVVLPGIEAPSAERSALIMRPYDQELVTCQRHLEFVGSAAGQAYGANIAMMSMRYVTKRSTPAFTSITPGDLISGTSVITSFTIGGISGGVNDAEVDFNVAGPLVSGQGVIWRNGRMKIDARL